MVQIPSHSLAVPIDFQTVIATGRGDLRPTNVSTRGAAQLAGLPGSPGVNRNFRISSTWLSCLFIARLDVLAKVALTRAFR